MFRIEEYISQELVFPVLIYFQKTCLSLKKSFENNLERGTSELNYTYVKLYL